MFLVIKNIKMFKKIFFNGFIFLIILFFNIFTNINALENKPTVSIGDKNAKVVVKVYSSLTCPHCANFHNKIFYKLKIEFIDKKIVKFEHHAFPLDLAALNAEKILRCSNDPEGRLKFLGEIYKKQDIWASGSNINNINSNLTKMAKNYELNNDKIDSCFKSEELEDKILNDRIQGNKKYTINSTPTILINEKKYDGKHNYKDFKKAIQKLL